jgi:mannose-6-phosphate isomerase-like protein (cupin superfamily)
MKSFSHFDWQAGKVAELDRQFPSVLHAWDRRTLMLRKQDSTFYGFVYEGGAFMSWGSGCVTLDEGAFFSVPREMSISGGRGIIIERERYNGVLHIGGPVEEVGRLRYIDGCTDTLLIPPQRIGEPCLNALFFPPGIEQTMHTHPSDRIGMIYSGEGECETPDGVIQLQPGMIFCIHTHGAHRFRTPRGPMRVIAFHPDSDFGPDDEKHPMINRTIVDGVSASGLDVIRSGADTVVQPGLL